MSVLLILLEVIYQMKNTGIFEIIVGCMFSGKSEEIIRRVKRATIARQQVQVFKHALDDRYKNYQSEEEYLFSHDGRKIIAKPVTTSKAILDSIDKSASVVAIDEIQFFDQQIENVIETLIDRGIRVIVAGLDMDFRGEPFGSVPILLAKAESVTKLNAICMVCGDNASFSQRLINGKPAKYSDPIVVVGAEEKYEARCRLHHVVTKKSKKNT